MSDTTPAPAAVPGYYQRHIFFCLNERTNGEDSCAHHNAQAGFDRCKAQVKAAGLAGPVAVVYPEGTWYTYVDAADIDEIVESHLKNGHVVERLVTPAELGR